MNTHEKQLRDKENEIMISLIQKDDETVKTFDFLYKHYALKELSGKKPILPVFEAIYIKRLTLPAWKLANYCNMSRSTLFNYRNIIINDFSICRTKNFILLQEIATTKED